MPSCPFEEFDGGRIVRRRKWLGVAHVPSRATRDSSVTGGGTSAIGRSVNVSAQVDLPNRTLEVGGSTPLGSTFRFALQRAHDSAAVVEGPAQAASGTADVRVGRPCAKSGEQLLFDS